MGEEKPKTEAEILQEELDSLRNDRAKRETDSRVAELRKQIEAERLDAKAEAIAERLADVAGKRGVDYEVVTGGGRIMAFVRSPDPHGKNSNGSSPN